MDSFWLLTIAIFAPLISGLVTLFLPRKLIGARLLIACLGMITSVTCLGLTWHAGLYTAASAQADPDNLLKWIPYCNLNFSYLADGLGMFFALLVSGVGLMIVLYARGYFGKDADSLYRFYPTLGFFATAMIGIVLSDNMLLTVLFWELTSISSFLLIGWDRYDKHAVKLAMQAFFTTGLGGMAMLGGVLMFGGHTGLWRWSELIVNTETIAFNDPWVIASFCLLFAGAATKSAQWPFHYWLPGAMAAPTPVSAYLHSATMVKAGVFLMGRVYPAFHGAEIWPWLLIPFGALTMVYGAIVAINQHDLKRIFAYTTVSQLGLLMCMWGLGALHHGENLEWAITQIANHACYKAPLFILAGALGHYISRDITQLNGAFKKQPIMVVVILLAGYGLAAGPGTISFQAKELFLHSVIESKSDIGGWWMVLMGMTVVTATCNVAIFVRLFTTLLGLPGGMQPAPGAHEHHEHHEHEHGFFAHLIWIPGLIIVLPQYIGGFFPSVWSGMFGALEANMGYVHTVKHIHNLLEIFSHPNLALGMSALAVACGIVLGFSPLMRRAIVDINDRIYPAMYNMAVNGGGRAFRVIQTGSLRHYIVFSLTALLIGVGAALYAEGDQWRSFDPHLGKVLEFWPGVLIGIITCATAALLPMVQQRVVRVLVLGSCGFSVVAMYLVYQAPDLALTQLMFEIISVILFVLVLRMLPKPDLKRRPSRLGRAVLATAVGLAIGWVTLVAATHSDYSEHRPNRQYDKLGEYFVNYSYAGPVIGDEHAAAETEVEHERGGGGNNIVNVILVDFRGFDTMGEITVLGIAALGVWALLPGRKRHLMLIRGLDQEDRE